MTKISIPGRFADDWMPAMESWGMDCESKWGEEHPEQAAMILALFDRMQSTPWIKQGKGERQVLDMTVAEMKFMRGEAFYRWEFNGGNDNPYGCEDPNPSDRRAAKALLDRLDAALAKDAS